MDDAVKRSIPVVEEELEVRRSEVQLDRDDGILEEKN